MVQIKPFKPFTFNEDLQNVVSPPFDSIPPNLEKVLKLNGHNITHLTLPETDPGALLRRWVGSGIIKPVKDDSILVLDQYYTWNGKMMRITGMIALVKVFPDDGSVKPHERTFKKYVDGRIQVMKSCSSQLEPIYLLVDSPDLEEMLQEVIQEKSPAADFKDTFSVQNRLYFLDAATSGKIVESLADLPAIVADGHHRLAASKIIASESDGSSREFWSWIMAYLVSLQSPGLKVDGIHRCVDIGCEQRRPGPGFHIQFSRFTRGNKPDKLRIFDGNWYSIDPSEELPKKEMDASLSPIQFLNDVILKGILGFNDQDFRDYVSYTHDETAAIESVLQGKSSFAALIPQWNKRDLMKLIADHGILPQKSTFFFPKPPSGLAINIDFQALGLPKNQ